MCFIDHNLNLNIVDYFIESAVSYERNGQFSEAASKWQIIVNSQCPDIDKILPNMSVIICLLKMSEFERAKESSEMLISLLETADQNQPVLDKYYVRFSDLLESFYECNLVDAFFWLLQTTFNLLTQRAHGESKLLGMCDICSKMKETAEKAIRWSPESIELFTNQYEFLDKMLSFMQNLPTTNFESLKFKGQKMASFLYDYGYICLLTKSYIKAALRYSQLISSWRLACGDDIEKYDECVTAYNNLGFALLNCNHFAEAKIAYQTSNEIRRKQNMRAQAGTAGVTYRAPHQ